MEAAIAKKVDEDLPKGWSHSLYPQPAEGDGDCSNRCRYIKSSKYNSGSEGSTVPNLPTLRYGEA